MAVVTAGNALRKGPLPDTQGTNGSQPRLNGGGAGGRGESQAWWLQPEVFTQPEFDADAYIADLRRNVPLETLSSELGAHLSSLKLQLVEVINADYADFVSLSTQLVNVDGAVARMQTPLADLRERLGGASDSVAGELAALEQGLRRRAAAAQLRATLELMQDAAHVMPKVEKLLGEVNAAAPGEQDLDARVRLYERVASEVSRLQFYGARGAGIPFLEHLKPRMGEARQTLQARLAEGLEAALERRNDAAVSVVLHSYAAIGDTAGAEAVVRRYVVRPLVEQALQGGRNSNHRPTSESLSKALTAIAQGATESLGPLMAAASAPASGLHAYDFLGACLLPEVDEAVATALPSCFSPGVPSAFLANYRAASSFLDSLEAAHVHSAAALSAFRAAPATQKFLRRWNLSVYFSLRFQEVVSMLDAAATEEGLHQRQPGTLHIQHSSPEVQLKVTAALVEALQKVVAQDVFLRPLADKFARLALQLTARYASWLRQGLGDGSNVDGGTTASDGVSDTQQASKWEAAEEVALVWGDVALVSTWLQGSYRQLFVTTLAFLPGQVSDAAAAAWDEATAAVAAAASPLGPALVNALATRCGAALKSMRGSVSTYRSAARLMPNRPGPYVPFVLQPLGEFLGHANAAALPEDVRRSATIGTISAVCRRFQAAAESLLEAERKTEDSLKRLNRSRTGSNTDKMVAQLFLDAQELGRRVFIFDTDPSEMDAYQQLWASLAPNGQLEVDAALLLG